MFRIRRIYEARTHRDRHVLEQIRNILAIQFPLLAKDEITSLKTKMKHPLKYKLKPIVLAAENSKNQVLAFAILLHAPDLGFMYLDFLSASPSVSGRGIGGILYEAVREESAFLKCTGLFMECLPDDPVLSPNPAVCKQNKQRLKFYERYGARPIANTAYETPLKPEGTDPPYLVFDSLNQKRLPSAAQTRIIVRAILERKYSDICPPSYINMVVDSFADDPIKLREHKYILSNDKTAAIAAVPDSKKIKMVINTGHEIHHVHERGYVESPVRIKNISKPLLASGLFQEIKSRHFSDSILKKIHSTEYLNYMKKMMTELDSDKVIYPYVFPLRNRSRRPQSMAIRAGYYCLDTFTPLTKAAYFAARGAVDCALTAAQVTLENGDLTYALIRPPGHHAEREAFGGFCYFNSTAAVAQYLSKEGKIAILDIDYHHGNGQQQIFYNSNKILTISIHGAPSFAYPYFTGFPDETGEGEGKGFNINYALAENISPEEYRQILLSACKQIRSFKPDYLVIAFGLDTAKGDPTGSWPLTKNDFYQNGTIIGDLDLATVVVQEGGYDNRVIGSNALAFLRGLWEKYYH